MFFKFDSSFYNFSGVYIFDRHFILRPRAYDEIVIWDREFIIVLLHSDFFAAIIRHIQKWSLDERDFHIIICDSRIEVPYYFIILYAKAFEKVRVLCGMRHGTYEFKEGVSIDQDYFNLVIELWLLVQSLD